MALDTIRPEVQLDPVTLAHSDALRAIRWLTDATMAATDNRARRRELLEGALGAALALQHDVQEALRALGREVPPPAVMTEAEARWAAGDR